MSIYEDMLSEIYMERERFLLSTDKMIEEVLNDVPYMPIENPSDEDALCCGVLIDVEHAETINIYPVCRNNCRSAILIE
jgi:hypothetical protein